MQTIVLLCSIYIDDPHYITLIIKAHMGKL